MAEESLRDFIARRKRELTHQIAAVDAHAASLRAELSEFEAVEKTLPLPMSARIEGTVTFTATPSTPESSGIIEATAARALEMSDRFKKMTIKELVVQALLDHYRDGGTLTEIRDFIRDAYGRVIPPSSLRPQMHRMKADHVLVTDSATDKWNLMPEKRRAYTLYNHPSSRAAMKELQDDEVAQEDCLSFTVAKGFKSLTRRFRPGMELEFDDLGALELFKQSLVPFNFDNLVKRGFLEAKDRKQN